MKKARKEREKSPIEKSSSRKVVTSSRNRESDHSDWKWFDVVAGEKKKQRR